MARHLKTERKYTAKLHSMNQKAKKLSKSHRRAISVGMKRYWKKARHRRRYSRILKAKRGVRKPNKRNAINPKINSYKDV